MTSSRASSNKSTRKGKQPAVAKTPAPRASARKRAAPQAQDSDKDADDGVDGDRDEDFEDLEDTKPTKRVNKGLGKSRSTSDTWLEDEANRRNPHIPLTTEQRRALGRTAGRGLIPWTRPHMNDKLLLILNFELARHQIEVPWDEIAHRLHPGSSGGAINQHLNRVRLDLAGKGHMVPPPIPKTNGSGFSTDPTVRGFMREDDEATGSIRLVPVKYDRVWEDRKVNLPDGFDASQKLLAAEALTREPAKKRGSSITVATEVGESSSAAVNARRMAVPATRARKQGGSTRARSSADPAELNSDSEYNPGTTKRRGSRALRSKRSASDKEPQAVDETETEREEEDEMESNHAGDDIAADSGSENGSTGTMSVIHVHDHAEDPAGCSPSGHSHSSGHAAADSLDINLHASMYETNPMISATTPSGMTDTLFSERHFVPTGPTSTVAMRGSGSFKGSPDVNVDYNEYLNTDTAAASPLVSFRQATEGYYSSRSQFDGHAGFTGGGQVLSQGRTPYCGAYAQASSYPGEYMTSTGGSGSGNGSGSSSHILPRPVASPYLQQSASHSQSPQSQGPSFAGPFEQVDGPAFHPSLYYKSQPQSDSPDGNLPVSQASPVYPSPHDGVKPGDYHYREITRGSEEDM